MYLTTDLAVADHRHSEWLHVLLLLPFQSQ